MGKTFADVQEDISLNKFPFAVVNANGTPAFEVATAGGGTRTVTPEDVGGAILSTLKATAEASLSNTVKQVSPSGCDWPAL